MDLLNYVDLLFYFIKFYYKQINIRDLNYFDYMYVYLIRFVLDN